MFGTNDCFNVRRRRQPFVRGLAVGVTLGVLLGGAGAALSVMGKQAWEGLPAAMQMGYMAGFTDCLRLAEAKDPGGWIAENYIVPPVTPMQWSAKVSELYTDENLAQSPLNQVIILAGVRLSAETGFRERAGVDPRLEKFHETLLRYQKAGKKSDGDGQADDGQTAPPDGEGAASDKGNEVAATENTEKPDAQPAEPPSKGAEPAAPAADPSVH